MSVWQNDWGKSDLPEFNTNQCYKRLPDKQIVCITNLERHCSGVELHGIKLGFCHPSLTFFFAAEFSSFNVKTIPLSSAVISNSVNYSFWSTTLSSQVLIFIPHLFICNRNCLDLEFTDHWTDWKRPLLEVGLMDEWTSSKSSDPAATRTRTR